MSLTVLLWWGYIIVIFWGFVPFHPPPPPMQGCCSYHTRSDTCAPASKNKRRASVQSQISWWPAGHPPPSFFLTCLKPLPPTAAIPLGRAGCRRTSKHGLMGKCVIAVCCVLISGGRLEEHGFTRTTIPSVAAQQFSFFAPPLPV